MAQSRITNLLTYDINDMFFDPPVCNEVKDQPNLKYYRINIKTKYPPSPDGKGPKSGKLIVKTFESFCFGLKEQTDLKTKKPLGVFSMGFVVVPKEGSTPGHTLWLENLVKIAEKAKDHVLTLAKSRALGSSNKDLEKAELKRINPVYIGEDEKTGEKKQPTLSVKAPKNAKTDKFETIFYDFNRTRIENPTELIGIPCYIKATFCIESVFISGSAKSLQMKFQEVLWRPKESGPTVGLLLDSEDDEGNGTVPLQSRQTNILFEREDEIDDNPAPMIEESKEKEQEAEPPKEEPKPTKKVPRARKQ